MPIKTDRRAETPAVPLFVQGSHLEVDGTQVIVSIEIAGQRVPLIRKSLADRSSHTIDALDIVELLQRAGVAPVDTSGFAP